MPEAKRQLHGAEVQTAGQEKVRHRSAVLTAVLAILLLAVVILGSTFVGRLFSDPDPQRVSGSPVKPGSIVQIDVLNGCGSPGAATAVTTYLRTRGYDVVEVRNYRSLNVDETFIIDRTGDLERARNVASVLGAKPDKILQQLNPDYYVDVSVVVGRDFHSLKLPQ